MTQARRSNLTQKESVREKATMKANYRLALMLVASAALGAAAITGLKAQGKPPVYAIIDISEILDAEAFVKAVSATEPNATLSAGGRFVIRSTKPVAIDGAPPPSRFAVIAFDTEEKAKAWNNLPAIKELNAVRLRTTKSRAFMVEGVAN
jgi:uncharacterized protein (DUF1330 family)